MAIADGKGMLPTPLQSHSLLVDHQSLLFMNEFQVLLFEVRREIL